MRAGAGDMAEPATDPHEEHHRQRRAALGPDPSAKAQRQKDHARQPRGPELDRGVAVHPRQHPREDVIERGKPHRPDRVEHRRIKPHAPGLDYHQHAAKPQEHRHQPMRANALAQHRHRQDRDEDRPGEKDHRGEGQRQVLQRQEIEQGREDQHQRPQQEPPRRIGTKHRNALSGHKNRAGHGEMHRIAQRHHLQRGPGQLGQEPLGRSRERGGEHRRHQHEQNAEPGAVAAPTAVLPVSSRSGRHGCNTR